MQGRFSGRNPFARRLRCEPLEDRRMLSITLFVDADSIAPTPDGLDWISAYDDLQSALSQASTFNSDGNPATDVDAIWIAEGTYKPTAELEPGDARSASFSLLDGVTLYGGFDGTETTLAERDWTAHITTLSGDLGTLDDNSDNAYTVAYCGENIESAIDGVSITGGNADDGYTGSHIERSCGGGICNWGTLTVTNSTLLGNSANYGGGIYSYNGTLMVTNCTLSGNSASQRGGGISNNGAMTITNCTISGNSASFYDGGISNNGTMTLTNCTLSRNSAWLHGGGISNNGTLTITNCTLTSNSAGRDTGGLSLDGIGGGIFNSNGTLTVTNCTFTGNSAGGGTGIYKYGTGGGIYNSNGTLTVTNCTFSGNSTGGTGAGISSGGALTVTNCTLSGNSAGSRGGAIHKVSGTLTITNSTLTANSAFRGGGVSSSGDSSLVTLNNTIIAGNESRVGEGPEIYLFSGMLSGFHNLIGDGSGQTSLVNSSDGNIVGTAASPVDPLFVRNPLDGGDGWVDDPGTPGVDESANNDYGDLRLRYESPAFDAGSNLLAVDADGNPLTTDLAGNPRIWFERVDMGAYEYAPRIDFTAVIVTVPTTLDANGESDARPAGADWIDEWQTFYVEVWVDTPATGDVGVALAQVDLKYNTDYHTATGIEYGAGFELLRSGVIDDAAGTVAGLGAGTTRADVGDDRHALLARVWFEPTLDDVGVPFDVDGVYVVEVENGIVLESPQGSLVGAVPSEVQLGDTPDTRLRAVSYDLDNSGKIDLGDLAFFASVYREQPGVTTESPYAYASDYDRSGTVDLGDLAFFAANYRLSRPNDSLSYPAEVSQTSSAVVTTSTTATVAASRQMPPSAAQVEDDYSAADQVIFDQRWMLAVEDMDDEDARDSIFATIGTEGDVLGLLDE